MPPHVYPPGARVWVVLNRAIRPATILGHRTSQICLGERIEDRVHGYDLRVEWALSDPSYHAVESYPVGRGLVWPTKDDALRYAAVLALRADAPRR